MVSDLRTAAKDSQPPEIDMAEFGVVSSRYFDSSKNYHGRLYRMPFDLQKSLTEAMCFSAKFELPSIRTAFMDVFQQEGHVVLEIERNTKPSDINVRYSRGVWNVQELAGKSAEGLRPWIKSEYHARIVDERTSATVAELLKLSMDDVAGFLIRINFKDRSFGLIGEAGFPERFPAGDYASFDIPIADMQAIKTENNFEDYEPQQDSFDDTTAFGGNSSLGANNMESNIKADNATTGTEQEMNIEGQNANTNPPANETPVESVATSEPATTDVAQPAAATEVAPQAQAPKIEQATEAAQPAPVFQPIAAERPVTPSEDRSSNKQEAAAKQDNFFTKQEPSRRSTATVERTERSTYTAPAATASPATRRVESTSDQPKYATYSKSEIDYMFKQQADQILTALSSKVAAQQRGFQEAITAQEKAFNRIAENFTTHFDEARIKLEHTTRSAQDTTHKELEDFHKQFTKELEQYRTQINKVVLPVSKALEDPNKMKAQQKDIVKQDQPNQKGGGGNNANVALMQKQLKIAIGAAVTAAVIALISGFVTVLSIAELKAMQTAATPPAATSENK